MNKLLAHPQKIIFLVRGLLYDIEERIFHDNLSHFLELIAKEQVLVVGEVPLLLNLRLHRRLLLILRLVLLDNLINKYLWLLWLM